MKNTILLFFILFNFAFAKIATAAVPIVAIQSVIKTSKDSLVFYDDKYWESEERAHNKAFDLIHDARVTANLAFLSIPLFFICAIIAEAAIFGALFLAFLSLVVGFILSIVSINKVFKIHNLIQQFPSLETNESLMRRLKVANIRSLLALLLLSLGFIFTFFFTLLELEVDILSSDFSVKLVKAIMSLELFLLLDKLFFQTKNKVK
jgi:hypothetical protein